jgi:hypothetical protein
MSATNAVGDMLGRLRDWWRRQEGLGTLDQQAVGLVAADLGISVTDLSDLIARGPAAADLLYERMNALGLSKDDVNNSAMGLMRDLQMTCTRCSTKGVCDRDLAEHPDSPVWERYCPNSVSLTSLVKLKAKASARTATNSSTA